MPLPCPSCRYNLAQTPSTPETAAKYIQTQEVRCPECGGVFPRHLLGVKRDHPLLQPPHVVACACAMICYAGLALSVYSDPGTRPPDAPIPWGEIGGVTLVVLLFAVPWIVSATSLRHSIPRWVRFGVLWLSILLLGPFAGVILLVFVFALLS